MLMKLLLLLFMQLLMKLLMLLLIPYACTQAIVKQQQEYELKCSQLSSSLSDNPALFAESSDHRRQSTAL